MREKWRYRCPKGHSGWKKRINDGYNRTPKSQFYCDSCRQNGDCPHFDELVDMKNPAPEHVADIDVEAV